jgi:hypothetical protein
MEMHRTHICNTEIAILCFLDVKKPRTTEELSHTHETEITKCLDGHHVLFIIVPAFRNVMAQHASKSASIETVHLRSNKRPWDAEPWITSLAPGALAISRDGGSVTVTGICEIVEGKWTVKWSGCCFSKEGCILEHAMYSFSETKRYH